MKEYIPIRALLTARQVSCACHNRVMKLFGFLNLSLNVEIRERSSLGTVFRAENHLKRTED